MSLSALRADALRSTPDGFEVRLSLPWIRSLPLAGVVDLSLVVDERAFPAAEVVLGGRSVAPRALADEDGWWFIQDRLVLSCAERLHDGEHLVSVAFGLVIPYLDVDPDAALCLPFADCAQLALDTGSTTSPAPRDVA